MFVIAVYVLFLSPKQVLTHTLHPPGTNHRRVSGSTRHLPYCKLSHLKLEFLTWRWWLIVDGLRRSACILGIRVVIKRRMIWFVMHNTVMKFLYMVRLFGGLMMKLFCFDFLLLRDRCDNIRNLKIYKKGAIFVLLWLVIFIFVCQYFLRTEVKK